MLTEAELRNIKPLRYARKISDSGGLYLLVAPTGVDTGATSTASAVNRKRWRWASIPTFLSRRRERVTRKQGASSRMASIQRS